MVELAVGRNTLKHVKKSALVKTKQKENIGTTRTGLMVWELRELMGGTTGEANLAEIRICFSKMMCCSVDDHHHASNVKVLDPYMHSISFVESSAISILWIQLNVLVLP